MKSNITAITLLLLAVACSGRSESDNQEGATAKVDSVKAPAHDMSAMSDTAADTSAMAAMNHGQMAGMGDAKSMRAGAAMPGMNHSQMQQKSGASGEEQSMAGMNHSQMSQKAGGRTQEPMTGMDHSQMNMPRAANGNSPTQQMPMQHQMPMPQQMPGMQMAPPEELAAPEDPATEKLRALVAELVRDPKIRARIDADTALKRRWMDPRIQQYLMKRP